MLHKNLPFFTSLTDCFILTNINTDKTTITTTWYLKYTYLWINLQYSAPCEFPVKVKATYSSCGCLSSPAPSPRSVSLEDQSRVGVCPPSPAPRGRHPHQTPWWGMRRVICGHWLRGWIRSPRSQHCLGAEREEKHIVKLWHIENSNNNINVLKYFTLYLVLTFLAFEYFTQCIGLHQQCLKFYLLNKFFGLHQQCITFVLLQLFFLQEK